MSITFPKTECRRLLFKFMQQLKYILKNIAYLYTYVKKMVHHFSAYMFTDNGMWNITVSRTLRELRSIEDWLKD